MFPADCELALCRFQLEGPFGMQPLFLLIPEELVNVFVEKQVDQQQIEEQVPHITEDLIRDIPLQVVVRLGATSLDVADLSRLRPGDVLVLDQRVTEPVFADIQGELELTAWAGREGNRQAIQVIQLS